MKAIDALSVNSIRVLAADAIQKANSGHPGLPLGSAPMAYEPTPNGRTGTASSFPAAMAPCFCIPFYTCSDTGLPRRIS